MSQLLLDSLEIKNFRAFDHLKIPKLSRVNLLTGKNNVGKTSVLEALELYASNGSASTIRGLLSQRGQYAEQSRASRYAGEDRSSWAADVAQNIRYLFHKAPSIFVPIKPVKIGPSGDASKEFTLELQWLQRIESDDFNVPPRFVLPPPSAVLGAGDAILGDAVLYVFMGVPEKVTRVSLSRLFRLRDGEMPSVPTQIKYQIVRPNGFNVTLVGQLWDQVQLTEHEQTVIDALRIISSSVERVSIKRVSESLSNAIIVKMSDSNEVVPLRSLGDGVNRLFGLILALVNAANGILLVDELENGLHYSVMPDVWRLIFTVAKQLNIQVFATTHSYDCIEAFQEAAQENKNEAALIRIENRNGRMITTEFDDRRLEIATKQLIEVR